MEQSLINEYQSENPETGEIGSIYAQILQRYGLQKADAAAFAALSGDETQINAALVGALGNTSTTDFFLQNVGNTVSNAATTLYDAAGNTISAAEAEIVQAYNSAGQAVDNVGNIISTAVTAPFKAAANTAVKVIKTAEMAAIGGFILVAIFLLTRNKTT